LKKVLILVEGETEEAFVNEVLNPQFKGRQISLISTIVQTSYQASKGTFRGGFVTYAKIRKQVQSLLRDTSVALVTTMLDLYGLPADFPGQKEARALKDPYQRVGLLTKEFQKDVQSRCFVPYLSLHEFEALLLTDREVLEDRFGPLPEKLTRALSLVSSPEEIDEGKTTHPSARLAELSPRFKKTVDGPLLARKIGITTLKQRCPHFRSWVETLENL
jgi:hypothetical protein